MGTLIHALPNIHTNVHCLVCGTGPCESSLRKLAKSLSVEDRVHFLGYRSDIKDLYQASDFFLMASKREGLPRSTMEAMASGLPCIVSRIRGNVDLIDEGKGGFLVSPDNSEEFAKAINKLCDDKKLQAQSGAYNQHKIRQFGINNVQSSVLTIYRNLYSNR